ncbi:Binding-protein-dependent transport systems inner membrane component OS=Tsukamurella paurometabola(strain ATCC 8368 / DSM / CCUG 35730 / CIP 100753 / JCM 10117 / KCTC 9821 / NBRC 16120 / NCIMB 702349 / NCTC 13040)OX=521096 GN=Tpau_3324 PE=3 SV=1 [Tsukamurella paurometabola]|uniref:Binding-protein-dependent transport systems inner membrane component n=1 Tax=Tsukamurella paurometabola (strain ATCC 8368 / DSM 20162 / CCUG 35730 / CIP 100753 / JCM 10117 / KCTC 9821 / NBRC 16120 / NCIMB 702349 / NCTC 13040) TaxID=521096 RepID=D5UWB0_TSUPD|nr:ABC transporter permease subunit [Tsukamurella paurometabola]ADG79909.1 binding-protein-dependent transport systems inner membrane component [Tsukamurella paurometabola DSM 20162]SUP37617.1 taurine transporter subunit [Tsukamurella paurometabola]
MSTTPLAGSLLSARGRAESGRRGAGIVADVLVVAGAAAMIWLVIRVGQGMDTPIDLQHADARVDTDPANLPYYAARSLLRMFLALGASIVFTFAYATLAARSRRARAVLMPLLDVLQSVPILGFLSITVTLFIALFPGSTLGLELAAIFAIFTSQAWNMTFAFYQSLISQPRDLGEAAEDIGLSRWQRFWRLDVPSGMIPLVWNAMMSFGGGWFFLTASEAVSVAGNEYALPGIGAYVASASADGDLGLVGWAIGTMIVVIIGVNFLFWSPLTAWAERFRLEDSATGREPKSVVLTVLRRSHAGEAFGRLMSPIVALTDRFFGVFGRSAPSHDVTPARRRAGDLAFGIVVVAVVGYGLWRAAETILSTSGIAEVGHVFLLGLATMGRVALVMLFATVVWVPIGVIIGLNPKLSRALQPVIQVFASFPANFLFPLITAVLIAGNIPLDLGGVVLMALGTQWYILFNVIAAASAIPGDLLEAADDMSLPRWMRWRYVLLPGVFAGYVTGGITAAGGAWNASIVAEVVSYDGQTYHAFGLGDYIADATAATGPAHTSNLLLGISVMCLFVVGTNALLWRRLYRVAERRYSL